jgi:hypothetical protein
VAVRVSGAADPGVAAPYEGRGTALACGPRLKRRARRGRKRTRARTRVQLGDERSGGDDRSTPPVSGCGAGEQGWAGSGSVAEKAKLGRDGAAG